MNKEKFWVANGIVIAFAIGCYLGFNHILDTTGALVLILVSMIGAVILWPFMQGKR